MPLTKGSRRAIASFVMVAMVTTIVSGGQVGAVPHVSRAVASHSTTVGAGVGTGTGTRHGHGHGHGHEHEHEHGLDAGFGAGTGALNSSDHDAGPKSPSPLSLLPPSPPSFSSSSSWTGSPTLLHREACPKYIFFTARGTNEPIIDPRGSRHLTDRVMRQVPGGLVQGVPYRATRDYLLQPERGAALLVQLVTDIARACGGSGAGDAAGAGDGGNAGGNADGGDGEEEGGTKVVVYGYSEGAMVVVNALNDPSLVPYAHLIVAIVLFGNVSQGLCHIRFPPRYVLLLLRSPSFLALLYG